MEYYWEQLLLSFCNSDHVVLKLSISSSASPHSVAFWLGLWKSNYVVLRLSIPSFSMSRSAAVWWGFWNYDCDFKIEYTYLVFASVAADFDSRIVILPWFYLIVSKYAAFVLW